jgi:hypothetical protein
MQPLRDFPPSLLCPPPHRSFISESYAISEAYVPFQSEQLFCVVTIFFESHVGEIKPSFVVSIRRNAGRHDG